MGSLTEANAKRRRYPTRAEMARAIKVARANGMAIGSLSVPPNEAIGMATGEDPEASTQTAFDAWEKAGRL